jgi:hypothetical protein
MDERAVTRRVFLRRFGLLGGLTIAGVLSACAGTTATPPTPKPAAPAAAPKPTEAPKPAEAAKPAAPAQAAPAKVAGSGFQWDANVINAYFAARDDIRRIAREERANLSLDVEQWT